MFRFKIHFIHHKAIECVQYLLVYLFPELFSISSSRALRNNIKYTACHFFNRSYASFQTSKINLGAIQMVRKSINRSHVVHVMRYQSVYNHSLAPPAPSGLVKYRYQIISTAEIRR